MSGFKKTEIGLLPEDWEVKKLGDILTLNYGKGLPADNRIEGKYPVYGSNGVVGSHNQCLVKKEGIIVGRKGSAGLVHYSKVPFYPIDTTFYITKDDTPLHLQFLFYLLNYCKLSKIRGDVGVPGLNREMAYLEKVIYPPLPEQQNIAHILSKIQSAIETQEKIIKTATELKKALMQKLFTEGLSGEPQKEKIGSFAEKGILEFQNGFPCGNWNEKGIGIPQIRPFNVNELGKIELSQIKFIEIDKPIDNYLLKENDIVFNNTNSEDLVGKTAVWRDGSGYVLSNHMTIIRIKDYNALNPDYLANFLHYKWFDGYYKAMCRRHVNQASVSIERLKNMDLPYPSIDKQNEVAKIFTALDKKIMFATSKHQILTILFKSMLHHLMTGQIRVKDFKFA